MRRHFLLFLGLVYPFGCFSQLTENHLITKYTQNEGLSSYNTRFILQDPKGFIWIATQDGLNLFDGKNFTKYTYNGNNSKKILASDVRSLTIDSTRHLIWILTNIGGINAIDYYTGRVVKSITSNHIDNDDWNISMICYHNKLWIGCMNSLKIYDINSNAWLKAPLIPFTKDKNDNLFSVRTLHADGKGNIWVFVNHYGIIVINADKRAIAGKTSVDSLLSGPSSPDLGFTSAIDLPAGNLLVGTTFGLKLISYDQNKFVIKSPFKGEINPLNFRPIGAIAKSSNNLYISDNTHLYKSDTGLTSFKIIAEANSDNGESWLKDITNLYVDKNEDVWIGCKQGLAFLSNYKSPFKSFSNKTFNLSGLTHVYSVFPVSHGDIIIGQENGLLKYDSTANKFTPVNSSKAFNFAFTDFENRTIVSADNGLFILNKIKLLPIATVYPELTNISGCLINSSINIGDSVYVMGSENNQGIFLWNYKRKTLRTINNNSVPAKLRSNIVNRVFVDSRGSIWVLSDLGIDIVDKDLLKVEYLNIKNPANGDPLKLYFDMCEANGKFWITSYSYGIAETDLNGKAIKIFNTNNGLCNDGVYKIFNRDNKNLIITSNNGLSVFNIRDSTFTNYYEPDGLHSNAFEEACGTEKDGKIYAGGLNGFTVIDPKLLFVNKTAPKLYFNDIKIDATSGNLNVKDLNIKNLTIPNDVLQTTISFSGLNYGNPNRVNFSYKIEELNSKWIDLGNQNFVNIIGISPGTYNLLVKASNENGVWTTHPLRLSLTFLPKWYQTWWFKLLVLSAISGVFYAFYLYRIRQIKAQQQIRREIANDLHDDLGSTLNSIKMFTHMALSEKQNTSHLTEIEKSITAATMGLRDMLWVLEDSRDNLNELIERIKKFAEPIADARQINMEYEMDEELNNQIISKTEKRNLLLILKEAVNNSFKYAQCKNIKVTFSQKGNKLRLQIADDGAGFVAGEKPAGYGLNNIEYRATQIGYRFQVTSSPGNGTAIIVEKR